VARPQHRYLRHAPEGQLVASRAASIPRTPGGRWRARIRGLLVGPPLSIHEELAERLPKRKALAVFSSDAISSSAYATEEILRVLILAGAAALVASVEVAIAIALLLATVAFSYRQVCRAFPGGGGAYAVARAELTPLLGLVAAAALLIDYVMTVAVSTSSALDQLASLVPATAPLKVVIAVGAIGLVTLANLRGVRESGTIFALPTYAFVILALGLVVVGGLHVATGSVVPVTPQPNAERAGGEVLALALLLRAFASGSVALTGVEAVANGVPAFKPPEAKNAAATLLAMAALLGVIFVGITVVAMAYHVVPSVGGSPSVVSLVAAAIYGPGTVLHGAFLVATMLILFLAANTSYNAFPRLAAILARDGYMPRQLAFRGDRLAFSHGIVILALIAGGLVVAFGGTTTALIPLYAVGVFVCFSLSQLGMVRHWLRSTETGRWRRLAVNAFGAAVTMLVLAIVVAEKLAGGAWLVVLLIPAIVGAMLFIQHQYRRAATQLDVRPDIVLPVPHRDERAVIPVAGIDRAAVQAVNVGRSIADDVRAVLISDEPDEASRIRRRWELQVPDVPLVVVESPYRALVGPLLAYLDVLDHAWPADRPAPITFVVLPEYVASDWWERMLYNQSAAALRKALIGRPHTVVVTVPYRRESAEPAWSPDRVSAAGGRRAA
jgi:amino acid transporter